MSFDLDALRDAVASHGRVARVVVAATRGSAPREPGAAMLVWANGQSGTIGGGALEWEAAKAARAMLAGGGGRIDRLPLGPGLGQCCGGAVTLATEVYDAAALERLEAPTVAGHLLRPIMGAGEPPLPVRRIAARLRRGEGPLEARLLGDWMLEPLAPPRRDLWIFGAGHVGRALVAVLHPLPDWRLTWLDTAPDRFPEAVPVGVTTRIEPLEAVAEAPADAHHLVLTYSHALDLELCHRLLSHGFASCGLIGSATKWARFRSRLAALGHSPGSVERIRCPIGDPALGKHPAAIAIGVAAELIAPRAAAGSAREGRA
jgi:xanthine dehydrogenase accessory factor